MNVLEMVRKDCQEFIGKEISIDGITLTVKSIIRHPKDETTLAFTFEESEFILKLRHFKRDYMKGIRWY